MANAKYVYQSVMIWNILWLVIDIRQVCLVIDRSLRNILDFTIREKLNSLVAPSILTDS